MQANDKSTYYDMLAYDDASLSSTSYGTFSFDFYMVYAGRSCYGSTSQRTTSTCSIKHTVKQAEGYEWINYVANTKNVNWV